MKRVLIIEPYFGGSHKQFLEGLMKEVKADYTLITLPARKWKMRMQLAAPWAVEQIKEIRKKDRCYDTVLCSTFVDVSVLRALVHRLEGWNDGAKFCLYLHENQFAYPSRIKDPSFFQFTAINYNSCIASDSLAFNSRYNRESFFKGCTKYLKAASDMKLLTTIEMLKGNSRIIYPGIDFLHFQSSTKERSGDSSNKIPVIVWNHRWEHDKNPEPFFEALRQLKNNSIPFRLIVLGQSFSGTPDCFAEAEKYFSKEIIHFGYAQSYQKYIELLERGDFVVSTALHEFFGIAVIEAVRAGCYPVLPNRLSYPELFHKRFLYSGEKLAEKLEKLLQKPLRFTVEEGTEMTKSFCWITLREKYEKWLFDEKSGGGRV